MGQWLPSWGHAPSGCADSEQLQSWWTRHVFAPPSKSTARLCGREPPCFRGALLTCPLPVPTPLRVLAVLSFSRGARVAFSSVVRSHRSLTFKTQAVSN